MGSQNIEAVSFLKNEKGTFMWSSISHGKDGALTSSWMAFTQVF